MHHIRKLGEYTVDSVVNVIARIENVIVKSKSIYTRSVEGTYTFGTPKSKDISQLPYLYFFLAEIFTYASS